MAGSGGSQGKGKQPQADDLRPSLNRRGSVFGFSLETARFEVERPVRVSPPKALFGSDLIAETLRELDIQFVAMGIGASMGELNDSLVNYLGNTRPQLISCLDEETSLAVAHGYGKVTGTPMAVALACSAPATNGSPLAAASQEAVPMLVLQSGAAPTAPEATVFQADLTPRSPVEARHAVLRAARVAETQPQGPVRVTLTADVQRAEATALDMRRNLQRFRARVNNGAARKDVAELAAILREAERPLILVGRVSRSATGWENRVILAELLGARVHAVAGGPAAFPTDHPLYLRELEPRDAQEADVVLSLDWPGLARFVKDIHSARSPAPTIVEVSPDVSGKLALGGATIPTPSDILIEAEIDALIGDLISEMDDISSPHPTVAPVAGPVGVETSAAEEGLSRSDVTHALAIAAESREVCITSVPEGWDTGALSLRGPLDFLGEGPGRPGQCVGSALALVGSGRIAVGVVEGMQFITGAAALWTAVHYRIPLLLVVVCEATVADSRAYQTSVADARGRNSENAWIGHSVRYSDVDIPAIAGSFGALGLNAGLGYKSLTEAMTRALEHVDTGGVAVVAVHVS